MKISKRLLSLALALALCLCPVSALAADSDFTVENGVLTEYNGCGGDVVIPDGVISIGMYAFYECTSLTSVTIPSSVTSIGDRAFQSCTSLTSVTIPSSVISIGDGAFCGCTSLTSVTIPDSVTSIGDSAFHWCTNLTKIQIDANNKYYASLDGVLFNYGKTELVCYPGGKQGAYTIPSSVTRIGDWAFYFSNLTSVTIPSNVTSIGDWAFGDCTSLTSVTIPSSVISIGDDAFFHCYSLTSVIIPDSVTSIGRSAFEYCYGLTSVTIPSSVTSIGEMAFYRCIGLTSVTILPGVTSIGKSAFSSCTGLTSVTIPSSVTSIGDYAFESCTSLTSMTIEDSVTSIGKSAFSSCTSLTSVTIPSSVTSIGDYAFKHCSSLTSVTIEKGQTNIGKDVFSDTPLLENQGDFLVVSGILLAYQGNDSDVTVPDSVTNIKNDAFYGCAGLASVTIPSGVTSIGNRAFYGCTGLTSVTIPSNVTSIGYSTFRDCTSLISITIPSSVTSIESNAFSGCTNLMDVYYSGHKVQWEQIKINSQNAPLIAAAIHYEQGSDPFQKTNTYTPGQFADVSDSSWYAEYVQSAYEYGMMNGVSDTSFDPNGNLTVASAIVIACRLHSLYYRDNAVFSSGSPWYQPYVDYAQENDIIDSTYEYAYNSPITRADFALLISNALPDEALPQINEIQTGDIPDISSGSPYNEAVTALLNAGVLGVSDSFLLVNSLLFYRGSLDINDIISSSDSYQAIYRLYQAGILTGNDAYGTFTPYANITRSSVATIISRTVEPALRQHITLTPKPTTLVPMNQLVNLSSLQKNASNTELAQAYEEAKRIVEPLANLCQEAQLYGVTIGLASFFNNNGLDTAYIAQFEPNYIAQLRPKHYNDPYGFFVRKEVTCAGCARAIGLCLNMLGIPYEHVNENAYGHQWCRVNVNGTYWVCDVFPYEYLCCPEPGPYEYPI